MTSLTNCMREPTRIEGLYVHVPFCDGKCGYCAFYSVRYEPALADTWLRALLAEAEHRRSQLGPFVPETIYFGGGTPTLLSAGQLEPLLGLACLGQGGEWTVEANPGSVDTEKLRRLRVRGVNRISLGVQSMDDRHLALLGRRHTVADIRAAVTSIEAAGFDNWSLDLIACVPGVSRTDWERTLGEAVALEPRHVSVYALTGEEGSALARKLESGAVSLLNDDEQLAMLDTAEEILGAAGFRRYEISNYAQPGHECRHNLACWQGRDYVGLGCAASSRVAARRWTNRPDLAAYVQALECGRLPPGDEEELSPSTDAVERLVFGLRMTEGVDVEAVMDATGLSGSPVAAIWYRTFARLQGDGLVQGDGNRWHLTRRGREVADHVAVELML